MAIGGSFGGGKVDQGCDDRELARSFSGPQTIASCKILISTKKAKKAGITLEDCMKSSTPAPEPVSPELLVQVPPPPSPIIVTVPVTIVPLPVPLPAPPQYKTEITVHAPKKKVKHMTPACQNDMELKCVLKSKQ